MEVFGRTLGAWRAAEVAAAVREVERAVEEAGLLAAGYLASEAAAAYGLSVPPPPDGPPLLWFGLFHRRAAILAASLSDGRYHFGEWQPALDFPAYAAALKRIKACLLYTSDAADERSSVDLGGRRIIKKKKDIDTQCQQRVYTTNKSRRKTTKEGYAE